MKKVTAKQRQEALRKRRELKALSMQIKMLIKEELYASVNEGLIDMYMQSDPDITKFHTFREWIEMGYKIKKGSTAFLIWGSKITNRRKKDENSSKKKDDQKDEFEFYPVCYLFANTQVEKRAEK